MGLLLLLYLRRDGAGEDRRISCFSRSGAEIIERQVGIILDLSGQALGLHGIRDTTHYYINLSVLWCPKRRYCAGAAGRHRFGDPRLCFHLQPGKPPVDVMLVIIAVVAASATLQASGGLDVMLQIAEKLLRRNPKYVSIVAPFVTCTLTILCGTGHVVYTILPIIYDVAIKNNIRPERPMAASSIGAQMGIIASPVSVAVVSLVAMLGNFTFNGKHTEFLDLLAITIPSTLLGILAIGIFSWFRGKDGSGRSLPGVYCATGEPPLRLWRYGDAAGQKLPTSNWIAMWIFLASIAVVALLGAFLNCARPLTVNHCRWCWLSRCLCCSPER